MQTCSICSTQSSDDTVICPTCQSDLGNFSTTAVALKRFNANPRVTSLRVSVMDDACPVCQDTRGAYAKDKAPKLPVEGCSHPNGCRCFYEPVLSEIFP